jgi:LmbE family N-acetylglucosaminyl deacetylase
MALAREAGERVVVVTATAGEQGAADPADRGQALGRLRRRELRAALAAVGVREHTVLGLPDGGCAAVPPGDGAAFVRSWITAARPDTIVTFGRDGMTGHDDHRAVHRWVTDARPSSRRALGVLALVRLGHVAPAGRTLAPVIRPAPALEAVASAAARP